ncbi:MAG: ABC transporter ATP-binding protein [Desulfobacteraceae bacterium]|nr:ABC transporter ATP-binding protein [Desulfobacteraceae bacterium]
MNDEKPLIELIDVHKRFQVGPVELEILKGVYLTIRHGEILSIMGTSGSGKSTMMNVIGFLDRPTTGTYLFEGRDISKFKDDELAEIRNRQIGFIFQQFNLLPRNSACDNVGLPLLYRGMSRQQAARHALPVLESVGMGDRADHRPNELSGGQQQRVAIARALVGSPSIIIADEPTGALDSRVGGEIMDLFVQLNKEKGITIIIITHDPGVATRCNRQLVMIDGVLAEQEGHDA